MRRLKIGRALAMIAGACFTFAAVGFIATGPADWWQPIVLLIGAACMGLVVARTYKTPRTRA